jgi:3-hydroxyacyl-[acyl-carrier-protein] dehydratase
MQGETTLVIAPDHPAFAGHFPGTPILPGVVLLDAAVHALLVAHRAGPAAVGNDCAAPLCEISSAKFLSPVRPGETLTISYRTLVSGNTHFEITGTGRKVAEGTFVSAP